MHFRLENCAVMIAISYFQWPFSSSWPPRFFINILTHERIKYDKIFTLKHWMWAKAHTYTGHILYTLLQFFDSFRFGMISEKNGSHFTLYRCIRWKKLRINFKNLCSKVITNAWICYCNTFISHNRRINAHFIYQVQIWI